MTDFLPQNIQDQQHNNGKFKIEKMQHFVVKCCIFCFTPTISDAIFRT